MQAKTVDDSADLIGNLAPIMYKHGVRCSPIEFYNPVNLHFYDAKSRVDDEINKNMWQGLPRQFALTDDCAAVAPEGKFRVLDVGCGTGLSVELLLDTRLEVETHRISRHNHSKQAGARPTPRNASADRSACAPKEVWSGILRSGRWRVHPRTVVLATPSSAASSTSVALTSSSECERPSVEAICGK